MEITCHDEERIFPRLFFFILFGDAVICRTSSCLRRGTGGDRNPRRQGEEEICPTLRCHHWNDSCVKMGCDESDFNVSFIARGKVTRQWP